MNNYIIISRTYAETTPESAEIGDFSDTGFITEREQVTFKKLVELMKQHSYCSSSGTNYTPTITDSFGTQWYTANYRTGTDREERIHYHHENTPNCAKYWTLAAKLAAERLK
jgi:hypothetical protein